jgi:hypothetical protein
MYMYIYINMGQAFNREMAKYRTALKQQRAADLDRARRASEELRQLPGGEVEIIYIYIYIYIYICASAYTDIQKSKKQHHDRLSRSIIMTIIITSWPS